MASRKLHVALVHSAWPPCETFGGIVRYLVCQAEGLRDRGHDVTVITTGSAPATTRTVEDGIRVVRLAPAPGRLPRAAALLMPLVMSTRFLAEIERVSRTRPIDIVEFSNWASEGFAHSVLKRRAHVTRISSMGWQREYGGDEDRSRLGPIADRWRDWTEAFPVRRSDLLFAHSAEHARVVASQLRLPALPEAMALGSADRADPQAASDAGERDDILFVGALSARKGFDVAVKGFARALPDLPASTRLTVAGKDTASGPGHSSYRAIVLAEIADEARSRIDMLDWVSDERLSHLYRTCRLVVAPSRYESFGLPLIEAMQYGRAVISTTAGGMPEVVTDGQEGVLVPPGDADALAAALIRLVNDDALRREYERAASERFAREFTQAAFAARVEDGYRKAILTRTS
jgi:glycogen synthase